MNRHLTAGLVLCGSFALVAGAVRQPELPLVGASTTDEALIQNVQRYAARQAEANDTAQAMWRAGTMAAIDVFAIERGDLESRILLAQINEDQAAVTEVLIELVEHDATYMALATKELSPADESTKEQLLAFSERLARSSYRLWEHRREFGGSK